MTAIWVSVTATSAAIQMECSIASTRPHGRSPAAPLPEKIRRPGGALPPRHVGPRVVLYPRHTHPIRRDTTLARSSHRPPPLAAGGPRPPLFLVDAHVQPTHARTTTAGQGSRSRLPGMHRRIA